LIKNIEYAVMNSVLIVDDDQRLLTLLVDFLTLKNFRAVGVESAAKAKSALMSDSFDCVVVDWMMPCESGLDFITRIREGGHHLRDIPMLMLSAVSGVDNRVAGLEKGADDYLTKPFNERELVARLNSLIKRGKIKKYKNNTVCFGNGYKFSTETCELLFGPNIVHLSTSESVLLKALCMKPNYPLSREELARNLMFRISDRTVDVQITRLRQKIGDNARNQSIIKTVRHFGYSIKVDE
jgi:two-component system phosphate regulon response regulator OmpR